MNQIYIERWSPRLIEIVDRGPPTRTAFVNVDERRVERGDIPEREVWDILEEEDVI